MRRKEDLRARLEEMRRKEHDEKECNLRREKRRGKRELREIREKVRVEEVEWAIIRAEIVEKQRLQHQVKRRRI